MKAYGWTWHLRPRRKGTPYIYAVRWKKTKTEERYIAPLSRLAKLTAEDLIAKLT